MRKTLITALLASLTVGVAGAPAASSSGGGTNALPFHPAAAQVAASSGYMTNTFAPGPVTNQFGSFSLGPILSAPLGLDMNPWRLDKMAADQREGWAFVDPDKVRREGEAFSHALDRLRAEANIRPLSFGRDKDIKFVESHTYRPGIPAPIGMSYPIWSQQWALFGEFAPILDATPSSALGWGGGLGIKLRLGE